MNDGTMNNEMSIVTDDVLWKLVPYIVKLELNLLSKVDFTEEWSLFDVYEIVDTLNVILQIPRPKLIMGTDGDEDLIGCNGFPICFYNPKGEDSYKEIEGILVNSKYLSGNFGDHCNLFYELTKAMRTLWQMSNDWNMDYLLEEEDEVENLSLTEGELDLLGFSQMCATTFIGMHHQLPVEEWNFQAETRMEELMVKYSETLPLIMGQPEDIDKDLIPYRLKFREERDKFFYNTVMPVD